MPFDPCPDPLGPNWVESPENTLIDILDDLAEAQTADDIQVAVVRALDRMGFQGFTYLDAQPRPDTDVGFFISNYPADWTKRYIDEAYRSDDPVLNKAKSTRMPFPWSADELSVQAPNRQKTVMNEARDYRVGHGITVPLHKRKKPLQLFTATLSDDTANVLQTFQAHRYNLLLLAGAIDSAVLAVDPSEYPGIPTVSLSRRQSECLLWTAKGKTAWEISQILSISERTVNFHLHAAMAKFDVNNKHHAVIKAITTGLIQP